MKWKFYQKKLNFSYLINLRIYLRRKLTVGKDRLKWATHLEEWDIDGGNCLFVGTDDDGDLVVEMSSDWGVFLLWKFTFPKIIQTSTTHFVWFLPLYIYILVTHWSYFLFVRIWAHKVIPWQFLLISKIVISVSKWRQFYCP